MLWSKENNSQLLGTPAGMKRYFQESICLTDSDSSGLAVFACYRAGSLSIVYLFKSSTYLMTYIHSIKKVRDKRDEVVQISLAIQEA